MNKEDKKIQKHLVNEMMKVSKTNPDVMIYMQTLMESYEKLEQEIIRLKEENEKLKQYKEANFLYDFEELQDKVINLQKENRELNRMCEIYSKSLYNADLTKAEKRIKKAIEYIKKHSNSCMFELRIEEMEDLLNILGGE